MCYSTEWMNFLFSAILLVCGFFLSVFLAAILMFENAMETWKARIAAYLVYLAFAFYLQAIGLSMWLSILVSVVTVIFVTDFILLAAVVFAIAKIESAHPSQ